MPSQLVLGQWVCILLYVVVCMKFSEFQNFNRRVKSLTFIILYCLLGSTFSCCKMLYITLLPENG